jgi:hypothetical protein
VCEEQKEKKILNPRKTTLSGFISMFEISSNFPNTVVTRKTK